jgi:hypothetical protein
LPSPCRWSKPQSFGVAMNRPRRPQRICCGLPFPPQSRTCLPPSSPRPHRRRRGVAVARVGGSLPAGDSGEDAVGVALLADRAQPQVCFGTPRGAHALRGRSGDPAASWRSATRGAELRSRTDAELGVDAGEVVLHGLRLSMIATAGPRQLGSMALAARRASEEVS